MVNNVTLNRVSYNGGAGGVAASPTAQEQAAANERHVAPTRMQEQHSQLAAANPELRNSVNHGRPNIAATRRPGGPAMQANRMGPPNHPAGGHPQHPHPGEERHRRE